jgi:hypothetical protein
LACFKASCACIAIVTLQRINNITWPIATWTKTHHGLNFVKISWNFSKMFLCLMVSGIIIIVWRYCIYTLRFCSIPSMRPILQYLYLIVIIWTWHDILNLE